MLDGMVYIMFLNGQRDQPDNKYVGVTTLSLDKRMKEHKSCQTKKDTRDSKLYRAMREKGLKNWSIEPLAELWLSTKSERRDLEKYYIRLIDPDLNT